MSRFLKKQLLPALVAVVLAAASLLSLVSCNISALFPPDATEAPASPETPDEVLDGDSEAALRQDLLDALAVLKTEGIKNLAEEEIDFSLFETLLRSPTFRPEKLIYADNYFYKYRYVGTYTPLDELLPDIMRACVTRYDPSGLRENQTLTDLMMLSYIYAIGDKYGNYYTEEDFEDYDSDLSAEYVGIGVQVLRQSDGYLEILRVYADSPALNAGLCEGDIIVAVDGEDVAALGYQTAIARVKGLEGTKVTITVSRDGTRLSFDMLRKKQTEYTVEAWLLTYPDAENIGFVRISEFDDGTFPQFVAAYKRLKAEGADRFIFDVRANPGGKLEAIVAILEYMLPDGPIVKMNYKSSPDHVISTLSDVISTASSTYTKIYKPIYDELGGADHVITEPYTVLTNGYTASAGELFSSAIRDYADSEDTRYRIQARLVGVKTYGKGMGQQTYALGVLEEKGGALVADGSYFSVSTFYYDPPFGDNYEGDGVIPHVTVELPASAAEKSILKLTYEEDTQLQKAIEIVNSLKKGNQD